MAKDFRILSLDGGGTWAAIQVKALIEMYGPDRRGHDVLKQFDLVAGNSGGSIVLAGLAIDMRLRDIDALFANAGQRGKIFAKRDFTLRPGGKGGRNSGPIVDQSGFPRYSTAGKHKGLAELMGADGQKTLAEIATNVRQRNGRRTDFLVVSFDYDRERAHFFRSTPDPAHTGAPPSTASLCDAVHASSTAPILYFDKPAEVDGRRLWDGAITGYNNPVLAAVADTLATHRPAGDIAVLSIGTGTVRLAESDSGLAGEKTLMQKRDPQSLLNDVKKMARSVLAEPPSSASYIAHTLLGGRMPASGAVIDGPVVRLNPMVQPQLNKNGTGWKLPDGLSGAEFAALVRLDMDAVKQREYELIAALAKAWIADGVVNQALRCNPLTLEPLIGNDTFSGACDAWKALAPMR